MVGPHIEFVDREHVLFNNQKLLYFAGTDYHSLSKHPSILKATAEAVAKYGISPTGSRATTGNHPVYKLLEQKIADFFDTESALLCPSGYLSNLILLQSIKDDYDLFLIDEQTHSSLVDAAKNLNKKMIYFKHLDPQNLQEKLQKNLQKYKKPLIMTDGVFPSRGEIPPLKEYSTIVKEYDGKLLIDDAHAVGVLGKNGKGSPENAKTEPEHFYQTGTLSKAFGTFGGFIPGSNTIVQTMQNNSNAFIGSTGIPLPVAVAAVESISYIHSNLNLITQLQNTSMHLKSKLCELGFDIPLFPTPIFSITLNSSDKNDQLYHLLLKSGIYPPYINYPGSPPGGHFRFTISSYHTKDRIEYLFQTLKSAAKYL